MSAPVLNNVCPVCGGRVSFYDDALFECDDCHEFLFRHELVSEKTVETRRAYARRYGYGADYGKRKGNR